MSKRIVALTAGLALAATAGAQTTGPAKPGRPKVDRSPDAIRCVRTPVTGSLAQMKKVCMTNREWDQHHDDVRRFPSLTCSDQTRCGGS